MAELSEVSKALLDSSMASLAGAHEQALIHARHALSLEPDNPLCHSAVARALVELGHRLEAVQAIKEALRIAPINEVILCDAIGVYRDAHEIDRAFEIVDRGDSVA